MSDVQSVHAPLGWRSGDPAGGGVVRCGDTNDPNIWDAGLRVSLPSLHSRTGSRSSLTTTGTAQNNNLTAGFPVLPLLVV